MNEIKTDLFPDVLRAGKKNGQKEQEQQNPHRDSQRNVVTLTEPLPESSRPRKDGPGGE